ncbi:MAG: Global nitrogen regulator [Syntrophorhabdaceae bacterium PtaU1.Bin034]|jgi:CRP/FNR family transcriptional regulator|nr:MAG: Global nitrogen regulator [Syntrophorhabdaceae bacterium PtaU1.Bin034]
MFESIPNSPYVVWDPKGFEEELSGLLAVSTTKTYQERKLVYLQGEKSDAFFFIRKGRVKISILKEDGSEKIIRIQEGNTFFGEYAAFDGHPHFASAIALEESRISRIPVSSVESVIKAHPRVAFLIINRIIRKFRSLAFQLEDLTFLDAQTRIARMLVSLAAEVGEQGTQGITIKKGITHEDLANLTGLSRVRVTTILNNFERADMIRKKRAVLTIIDPTKLRNLADGAGALGQQLAEG